MAISIRSANCRNCAHCIDASITSGWPISCGKTGATKDKPNTWEKGGMDFHGSHENELRIMENADCPNFELTENPKPHIMAALSNDNYKKWPENYGIIGQLYRLMVNNDNGDNGGVSKECLMGLDI